MEDNKTLEQMLLEAAQEKQKREQEQAQKSTAITKEDLAQLFAQFETKIDERIQKAKDEIEAIRGEGVGRKGTILDERENDPVAYLVSKARDPQKLNDEDKILLGEITNQAFISLFSDKY